MILEMNAIAIREGYSIYFKTLGQTNKRYEQRVEVSEREIIKWGCTCPHGSAFRFSKKYEGEDKRCRHIKEVIDLLKYLGYIKNGM